MDGGEAMIDLEERLATRVSGPRFIAAGLIAGLCGIGPLALHILFGPADGNPIGLGLLAMAAVPVAGALLALGAVKTIVALLAGRGR